MNVMVSLVCVNVAGVSRRVTGAVFVSWWGGGAAVGSGVKRGIRPPVSPS